MPASNSLRLITREFGGFTRSFAAQAEDFSAIVPGFELEVEQIEVHSLYERMVAGKGAAGDVYDLFLAVTDWLPELIDGGLLTPLDGYLDADPPPDWPHGWSESLLALQLALQRGGKATKPYQARGSESRRGIRMNPGYQPGVRRPCVSVWVCCCWPSRWES